MKLFAGIVIAFGSLFLVFHTRVVDFAPSFDGSTATNVSERDDKPINIIFVGDVMLGRAVEDKYLHGDILTKVAPVFNSADAVVANLEGPVLSKHIKTPYNAFKFSFATTTLDILKSSGFTDLSLANNHTDNYGRDGYIETILNLKSSGLNYFGDPNLISEYSTSRREIAGTKFVFVGINDTYGNLSTEKIIEFAKNLRVEFADETLVFVMHWGEEYKAVANERQTTIGRGLIDAGVDLVVGSHPHVVQNIEKYKEKYIFYSLGNFIFDQYFSTSTQEGLAINFKIESGQKEINLLPLTLYKSTPEFLSGEARDAWLKEYSKTNEPLKADILSGILK